MTPFFPISSSFMEKEEDDHQNLKLYIFSSSSQASSSQLPYGSQHDQTGYYYLQDQPHQLPHHHIKVVEESTISNGNNEPREAVERLRDDHHQELEDHIKTDKVLSAKNWMSSKMRLMQKMMIHTNKKAVSSNTRIITQNLGNHRHGRWESRSCSSSSHDNNGVRVCSDCNTTTTPLWRSGPQGPKSLCNACGIRQRKARRAMAAAANGSTVVVATATDASPGKHNKEKKSRTGCHDDDDIVTGHEKNSSDSQSEGHVSYNNFTVSLRKRNSGFGRVFPRDEEEAEAAILLMEMSCGLVHSC